MPLARASFTAVLSGLLAFAGGAALFWVQPAQAQNRVDAEPAAEPVRTDEATAAETEAEPAVPLTLEKPDTDPLLPGRVNGRALTVPEQARLRLGLERLERSATAAYVQGDRPSANRQFFRLLALAQYLPPDEELRYLTRVGRIAWQDSRAEDVQLITQRVRTLDQESGEKISLSRRQALAEAYESLGAWAPAIAQYETLLAVEQPDGAKAVSQAALTGSSNTGFPGGIASDLGQTQPSGEAALGEAVLVNRLAQLSLFNLNYPAAVLYTEQAILLAPEEAEPSRLSTSLAIPPATSSATSSVPPPTLSPGFSNTGSERPTPVLQLETDDPSVTLPLPSEIDPARTPIQLLNQLAYAYEQDQRFAEAAAAQQQLYPLYGGNPLLIRQQPALQVAIAQNQARSGQPLAAIATYQTAYRQSQTLQQFGVSSNALSQLAGLYRREGQLADALSVYNVLLEVQELSYNLYGITDTQVSRAEIFVNQQQVAQARQAYRQALYTAKLLGYRETELQQRLENLPSP